MKYLTYEEFINLAKENYENGGDGYVECLSEKDWECNQDIYGHLTKTKALRMFKSSYEIDEEYRAASRWYGLGAETEEEEKEILESWQDESYEFEEHYNPCEGCPIAIYGDSHSCKRSGCKYGDDGNYESPLDVYSPAELGISVSWR